jgi:hypothetical protein
MIVHAVKLVALRASDANARFMVYKNIDTFPFSLTETSLISQGRVMPKILVKRAFSSIEFSRESNIGAIFRRDSSGGSIKNPPELSLRVDCHGFNIVQTQHVV